MVGSYPDNLHKSFLRSLDRKNKNLLLCKLESWCGVSATWITVAPLLTSLMASAWGTLVSWRTSPSAIRYSRLLGGCWGWTCWPASRTCPWTTPTCLSPTWITAPWIEGFPWWSEAVIPFDVEAAEDSRGQSWFTDEAWFWGCIKWPISSPTNE